MFTKILIANRGEIACRIIRTARRMGIATVAVYSDADRHAPHVRLADQAVAIGPAPAVESYLSIPNILAACRASGADAVHPGYGFLSERADFAQALGMAGIAFIGPNPAAIAAMGDKILSKQKAAQAGVFTVPGQLGTIESPEDAVRVARDIGYPVMIKASAGGGGKGMRIAHDDDEARHGFARARSEAASSFGDDRIFIEKYIQNPRHIEIQVLGDTHGHVIHLGERECSVQRRNQKVLEEAPSAFLDDGMRARMGAQAVALARAVGYDSAGTVEFVVGQDKSFYFLEMNTRLQVEHPVTECVTGLDLVEQMIRIAAGQPLALRQQDIRMQGWSIESRIYAEDPAQGFLPSSGRLSVFRPPVSGNRDGCTIRVDTGVEEGGSIPIHYDPMIAKLITHAATRAAAIAAHAKALDGFAITGVRTNLAFLSALMANPRWQSADLSTHLIAEEFGDAPAPMAPDGPEFYPMAAICVAAQHRINRIRHDRPGRDAGKVPQDYVLCQQQRQMPVSIRDAGSQGMTIRFADGPQIRVDTDWLPPDPLLAAHIDGIARVFRISLSDDQLVLESGGHRLIAAVVTPNIARLSDKIARQIKADGEQTILSPMPGLLKELHVAAGDLVQAGQEVAVIEAMKMEISIRALEDGRVRRVDARSGAMLDGGTVLLVIDTLAKTEEADFSARILHTMDPHPAGRGDGYL